MSCCAYGCNNRFGERQGLGFYKLPAVPEARRKEWIRAVKRQDCMGSTKITREYVATILYHVGLQEAVASTRLQLCAASIKSFSFQRIFPSLSVPETQSSYYSPSLEPLLQGGVTPIDSIVTAATAGQSFDRLFSAV